MSQPKLNQKLSSTEFEVRLHSYSETHHTQNQTNSPCCGHPPAMEVLTGISLTNLHNVDEKEEDELKEKIKDEVDNWMTFLRD